MILRILHMIVGHSFIICMPFEHFSIILFFDNLKKYIFCIDFRKWMGGGGETSIGCLLHAPRVPTWNMACAWSGIEPATFRYMGWCSTEPHRPECIVFVFWWHSLDIRDGNPATVACLSPSLCFLTVNKKSAAVWFYSISKWKSILRGTWAVWELAGLG